MILDVVFRWAEVSGGGAIRAEGGIGYLPFDLAVVAYAVLVVAAVLVVVRSVSVREVESATVWLGAAWMLASIPLMLDLLVDTAEFKWPVIVLFVVVTFRYWKGARNSHIPLMLAPVMVAIAALDGLGHSSGQFCAPTGLDACPVKALSDVYLVMVFVGLTAVTLAGRNERPQPRMIALGLVAIAVAFAALTLLP